MDRRHPLVDFDASRFEGFFRESTRNLEARLLSGGACNSNYVVSTPKGERFVCRIHSRGNPAAERTVTELVGGLIPVPDYLWVGEGVSVLSFLEGSHFRPTRKLMREAGRIIATLKTHSFPQKGQILASGEVVPFEGWESFEKGLLGLVETESVQRALDCRTREALKKFIEQQGELLQSFDSCQNLVHGDFRPDNILVSEGGITGVLDWEFAHSGSSYMDIGNLLRHVSAEWEKDLAIGLREGGFELPPDWRFRSLVIDLASHLEFLTSDRSREFKKECVLRIKSLLRREASQGSEC